MSRARHYTGSRMGTERLVIHGAREHNLKNVTLDLPRDELIVFTGLSGSGKSSLAFDTIYAEGQRRYVESLSSYARQFLGQMEKPDVDFIEGLSPAISIDQKSTSRNPRSTVGTITEVYDYLRVLYARVGHPHCPNCGRPDRPPDPRADRRPGPGAARGHPVPGAGARSSGAARASTSKLLAGPRPQGVPAGAHRRRGPRARRTHPAAQDLQAHDRGRGRPPGRQARHPPAGRRLDRDRARAGRGHRRHRGPDPRRRRGDPELLASSSRAPTTGCPSTSSRPATSRSTRRTGPAPRATGSAPGSRSTPSWSSPTRTCRSTRERSRPGPAPRSSTGTGCSTPWARRSGSTLDTPWQAAAASAQREIVLYGSDEEIYVRYKNRYGRQRPYHTTYEGVIPNLERRHQETDSDTQRDKLEQFMREVPCRTCKGARLKPETPRRHGRRAQHLRSSPSSRSATRCAFIDDPGAVRPRADDRRAAAEGDPRAPAGSWSTSGSTT